MNDTQAVVTRLALRAEVDLVTEPWSPQLYGTFREQASVHGALDGAMEVCWGAELACRFDYWDQLDLLLVAWLEGLEALAHAPAVVVRFPDTRIEAALNRETAEVRIEYEDVDVALPMELTVSSLKAASKRLLTFASEADIITPGLQRLDELLHAEGEIR